MAKGSSPRVKQQTSYINVDKNQARLTPEMLRRRCPRHALNSSGGSKESRASETKRELCNAGCARDVLDAKGTSRAQANKIHKLSAIHKIHKLSASQRDSQVERKLTRFTS
eukprot:5535373-Amphidinium_carterae.1